MLVVGHRCPCSLNMLYMSYSFLCCCYFATVYSFTVFFFTPQCSTLSFWVACDVPFSVAVVGGLLLLMLLLLLCILLPLLLCSSSSSFFCNSLFSLPLVKIIFRLAFIYCNRFTCNCLCPVTWMGFPFRSTSILAHHFTNYALKLRREKDQSSQWCFPMLPSVVTLR